MGNENSIVYCPACKEKTNFLIDWEFSGLDDSIFNFTANYYACPNCGLVYTENISDEELSQFYNKECSYFEKAHFDISAPGNIKKYKFYRGVLINEGLHSTPIADIGCGRGGFLIWLMNNDWNAACIGVDMDLKSIPNLTISTSNGCGDINFHEGTATDLPFENETQSILSYFHVIEHVRNIDKVLNEAFRTLKKSGYILIEVPDAELYHEYPIGTAFWPSIREHVNHFSANAIYNSLQRNGFTLVSINRNILPTPEFSYPSLMILAQKGTGTKTAKVTKAGDIASFIVQSKEELNVQAENIVNFSLKYSKITFWGCSAQLFSLLPLLRERSFSLCDGSKMKQKSNFRGIPVNDPTKIQTEGALIIAPYLYGEEIEKAALALGWPKEDIFRLR